MAEKERGSLSLDDILGFIFCFIVVAVIVLFFMGLWWAFTEGGFVGALLYVLVVPVVGLMLFVELFFS